MAVTIAIAAGKTMAETFETTQKATVRAIHVKYQINSHAILT